MAIRIISVLACTPDFQAQNFIFASLLHSSHLGMKNMNSFFNYAKTKRETGNKKYTVYAYSDEYGVFGKEKI
ncbi:MAG: hypothetical protein ACI90V_010497 [Bacillariaceae sp.]|jgi:hypothetical protein